MNVCECFNTNIRMPTNMQVFSHTDNAELRIIEIKTTTAENDRKRALTLFASEEAAAFFVKLH